MDSKASHPTRNRVALTWRPRRITWVVFGVLFIGIAVLSASPTSSHYDLDITSTVTGTTALTTDELLPVKITLNVAPANPVTVAVYSARQRLAQLIVDENGVKKTVAAYRFTLDSTTNSLTFDVKPLRAGRVAIFWNAWVPGGQGHRSQVFQVDITSTRAPADVGMTTKTFNGVKIMEMMTDRWRRIRTAGIDVDHSIGDNSSVTYQVSLTGDACPTSGNTSIVSLSARHIHKFTENSAIGITEGKTIPSTRQSLGGNSVMLTFTACDTAKQVTVYGIPDSDPFYSVLILDHTLTQRNGVSLSQALHGPTLTLWVSDILLYTFTFSSPLDPYRQLTGLEYSSKRVRHLAHNNLYTDALIPTSAATADATPWTETCLKIHDPAFTTRTSIDPTLPLASVTLIPRVGVRYHGDGRTFYEPYGTTDVVPPLVMQIYTEVVNEDGSCGPAPTTADAEGKWKTFFDASKYGANDDPIGTVSVPYEDFNKFLNIRMKGVIGGEKNADGTVTVSNPHGIMYGLALTLGEYHENKTRAWIKVIMRLP